MKKLFLPFLLLWVVALQAQSTSQPAIRCGNDIFGQILRDRYPDLDQAFQSTFETARQNAGPVGQRSPYTINVVVHVLWKEPEENLADDIILDQIAVLNEDYAHTNADAGELRAAFQDVAGSADIQFNLAQVVRVNTDKLFEIDLFGTNLLAEAKHDADGGSDAWDPEHYLNVWICNIQPLTLGGLELGQILGFAFPPNNLANWPADNGAPTAGEDGVVLDYRVIGRNNPNTILIPGTTDQLVVRGRSAVHEIGHYLGLRHIWGDGGVLGLPNDCAQSDGIDDTPFAAAQSNFDCDKTKNTCEQVEDFYSQDMPDLIENYMDYASEDCMVMFTGGQIELMRSVLEGPRAGLLTPVGTHAPNTVANWQISPNPAGDFTRIALKNASPARLLLHDAQGRLVQETAIVEGQQQLTLETGALPAGLYFVELQSAAGNSTQRLLVK